MASPSGDDSGASQSSSTARRLMTWRELLSRIDTREHVRVAEVLTMSQIHPLGKRSFSICVNSAVQGREDHHLGRGKRRSPRPIYFHSSFAVAGCSPAPLCATASAGRPQVPQGFSDWNAV